MQPRYPIEDDSLTYAIIGCAISVHKQLGPGLRESSYEEALARELEKSGLSYSRQRRLAVSYDGRFLDRAYRPDFVIAGEVVLEVKSVAAVLPIHSAQILTYMRLGNFERGLLINFNVPLLIQGVHRLVMTKAPESARA